MLKNAKQETARRAVLMLLTAVIVLRDLFTNLYYLRPVPALHANIWELLIIGQFWTLCLRRKEKTKLERLLVLYAAWGVLTRFVLRDFTGKISLEVLVLLEMCVAFFAMHNLDKETASRAFNIVTAVLCTVLTVWAVCGLIVMLTEVGEIRLLNEEVHLVLNDKKGVFLEFYPINRNETSAWFMVGLWLLVYQWVTCKRKLWRIPMGFSIVLHCLAIAMQQSRTIFLIVGFCVGLLAAAPMWKRAWKNLPKYLLMAVTVAACTFVIYKVFYAVNAGLNALSKGVLKENRSLSTDLMSMSGRKMIWKCEIYALLHHPNLLLFGQVEGDIPRNMIRYGGLTYPYGHTHNGMLQVLAMYGLPGLAFGAGILLLLARKILDAFFGKTPSLSGRILSVILIGLAIQSLMEPVFTAWMGLSTVLFMMAAGWLTREDAAESVA